MISILSCVRRTLDERTLIFTKKLILTNKVYILSKVTETFRLVETNKGTFTFELFAEHESDVSELN